MEIDPDNTDAILKLVDCYSLQGNQDEADIYLEFYYAKKGKDEEYYLRKINSLLSKENIVEAQQLLSDALQQENGSLRIVLLHVDILISHELFQEAYDYLVAQYGDMLEEEDELLDRISFLSIQLDQREKALEYTTRLLALDNSNTKYKKRLALFLMEEYDFAKLESYLPLYTNDELIEIVNSFFKLSLEESKDRKVLIIAIKNIIENRTLYKSLKF